MATTSESAEVFDWLSDGQLEELVLKLHKLPIGTEFKRLVEESMEETIHADKTYDEITDDCGDLVGYIDDEESQLPWWLRSFDWTVEADPMETLEIDENSLDEFEDYPLDSTRVKNIELNGASPLVDGLDAFSSIEENLSMHLDYDVDEISREVDFDPENYEMPERIFMIPEDGRLSTSDEFEEWFERMLNLCPPASPELTALLRVNVNLPLQKAKEVLTTDQIQRLEDLSILESSDEDESTYNEEYYEALSTLLGIDPPFDLEVEISNDKDQLTDLQYAYYRSWAQDTESLSKGQKWLRYAKNKTRADDRKRYRFTEYAFRIPVRINQNDKFRFEGIDGGSSTRNQVADVIEEHGHRVNDD